ncbi:MAG: glutamate-5-semialdehyde dehydrogenase [Clostridia bacterium]|nr:glutamate-5-semialdehyde dehydrogenase [Oscillospiraceae bacterium]MBQ7033996.1 glutamate-5-semialdehyde dehydrogenase [Clostridia bacterium]
MTDLTELGKKAKAACRILAGADTETKNEALRQMAASLRAHTAEILAANGRDVKAAREKGTGESLLDRLSLTEDRISVIAADMERVATLPDPVGEVMDRFTRPNGLAIEQVRVPMGVIAIIYESRPNVTADAAALCIKTANAVILKGGSDAIFSNIAIADALRAGLEQAGLPADAVQLLADTDRAAATALMRLRGYVDLLIPRGGAALIKNTVENATVPVIETGTGNCHIYIDKDADIDMGVNIIVNAKAQRPGVCNAAETLLVHEKIAADFLPRAAEALQKAGVELRGCEITRQYIACTPCTEMDFATEFLDYILAIRVVSDIDTALAHISQYSTLHSEAIVTENNETAEYFLRHIDAAAVYVNASTRFTDGGEFGFGAEIGISTQKLHARGPMGLRELTSYQYRIRGTGQIR